MPIISRFFGIIYMYWQDHAPPHFHAKYQNYEMTMEIFSGKVSGNFSKKGIKLVNEWRKLHKKELLEDWDLGRTRRVLKTIDPLE